MKQKQPLISGCFFVAETDGLAFLRKSHGGCDSPPDCRQEPPFEYSSRNTLLMKKRTANAVLFSGGDCWTRTSDLLRVKQAL